MIFSGSDVCYGEYNKVWEWYREGEGAKLRNEKFLLAYEQLLLPGMEFKGSKKEVLKMLRNRLRRNFHTIYAEVIDENTRRSLSRCTLDENTSEQLDAKWKGGEK